MQVENVLGTGLAGTMRLPTERTAQNDLHLACLRRIYQARVAGDIDDARAFLLVNLIATYLPLTAQEQDALRVQLE